MKFRLEDEEKKKKANGHSHSQSYFRRNIFERIRISDIIFYTKVSSLSILILSIVLSLYYGYLNNLYLVDEVYEGTALRELELVEKTTIILNAPISAPNELKKFVEYYSLCQCVHEIVVIWNGNNEKSIPFPLPESYFKFSKTHSKVKIANSYIPKDLSNDETSQLAPSSYAHYFYNNNLIDTSSIMFLDIDIKISCESLKFTHNVWRSANESVVGLFPRSHT